MTRAFAAALFATAGASTDTVHHFARRIALAIETGCDPVDIGKTIHAHPTLSETIGMSAEMFEGTITELYVPKKK